MFRRLALIALTPVLSLTLAAPAGASTQIGQLPVPYAWAVCGGAPYFQTGVLAGTTSYSVPAGGGVITSWSTRTETNAGTAKLEVVRKVSAGQFLIVGADGPRAVAANSNPSFSGVRIPVQAGDMIGMLAKGTNCIAFTSGLIANTVSVLKPGTDPIPGTVAPEYAASNEELIPVVAKVEPDADHDGYGDESQDQCPSDPSTQVPPCNVVAPTPVAAETTSTAPPAKKPKPCRRHAGKRRSGKVRRHEARSLRRSTGSRTRGCRRRAGHRPLGHRAAG